MTLEEWSAISEELQTLLKIKPKKDETADSLARRLAAKANKVSDEDWEAIAEPTQLWVNSVLESMEKSEPLPLPEELALAVDEAEDDEAEPEGEAEAEEATPDEEAEAEEAVPVAGGETVAEEAAPDEEGEVASKPAKVKGAKKPTKAKGADSGEKRRVGRPGKFPLDSKIKILVAENPHRKNSARYTRWQLYNDGMTVVQALSTGLNYGNLHHSVKDGHIKIG